MKRLAIRVSVSLGSLLALIIAGGAHYKVR